MKLRALIISALLLAGCSEAETGLLSVKDVHQRAQAGDVLLIDVRTPEEWAATGTAPEAARITLQDADFLEQIDALTKGDHDQPVAFICRSGNRSGRAAEMARAAGYRHAYNVEGGMMAPGGWIEADLPVTGAATPEAQ